MDRSIFKILPTTNNNETPPYCIVHADQLVPTMQTSESRHHPRRRRRRAAFEGPRHTSKPRTHLDCDDSIEQHEADRGYIYGRLEMLRSQHIPCLHLTERPLRRTDSPIVPISFLLEPQLTQRLRMSLLKGNSSGKDTFSQLAQHRLGITHSFSDTDKEEMRIVLKMIDSRMCVIQPATLDGIYALLSRVHFQASECFRQSLPLLRPLVGRKRYLQRINSFDEHWACWKKISDCMWYNTHQHFPSCGCERYSFDQYCDEFQEAIHRADETAMLVATRKMMFILINCNQFFGMDGKIYNHLGYITGDEFITLNQPVEHFNIEVFSTPTNN